MSVVGCVPATDHEMMDLETLSPFTKGERLNAVIEIPAGNSDKFEYDPVSGEFPISTRDGQPRRIKFLPYPANYGFIPGTKMHKEEGGDGDAVDVFVLCGAVPVGTGLEVEAIGIIELLDAGERDDKLVAIPVDPGLRTVDATDIHELPQGVRDILVTWLLNYDPVDGAELVAVKGRADALRTVKRWQLHE
jgi:inorganic pyrophosphatase